MDRFGDLDRHLLNEIGGSRLELVGESLERVYASGEVRLPPGSERRAACRGYRAHPFLDRGLTEPGARATLLLEPREDLRDGEEACRATLEVAARDGRMEGVV